MTTLSRLLYADPADCGCDAGSLVLAEYVELERDGEDPSVRFPELFAHLGACPACRLDHDGLLDWLRRSTPPK
jgi:hypothetical protein